MDFNNTEDVPSPLAEIQPRATVSAFGRTERFVMNILHGARGIALAAVFAVSLIAAPNAHAVTSQYIFHEDGTMTEYVVNDENFIVEIWEYDKDGNVISGQIGNPGDGDDTGLVDYKAAIEDAMKNGAAGFEKVNNFLETTLGQTLIKHSNTGSIVPLHNPDPLANGLVEDPLGDNPFEQEKNQGGSTGGGWYDPMGGSLYEQMMKAGKKNKGKGSKGSGDAASDAHDPGYEFSADPALVNPVPVQLPVAKPALPARVLTKKAKRTIGNTVETVPTIPNQSSPAAATEQPSAAVGNLRTMRGRIRIGMRPVAVRTMRLR
jgi:hypothetical protein